ncbi:MAG: PEP-CTERM sorting domain-containing protein [Lysobacteraceae bacterium]|nr:MAG: PEP-CTERM sorting domain-containing protein [Xanthomonadaceae bacterium]
MASSTGWTSFITNGANYLGGTADRSFSPAINTAATVWLIGAGRGTGSDDSFKLSSIGVTAAVPEPASWAMMIVGFGAVGATMRRRKGKVATTVSYA